MGTEARIVLTRSEARNRSWAEQLDQEGRQYLLMPLTEHRALPWAEKFESLEFDWLMFTSPTGVEHFLAAGMARGNWNVTALGAGTETALRDAGWTVDYCPNARDGRELATGFAAVYTAPLNILLAGPLRRLNEPSATLLAGGYSVKELALYETHELAPIAELQAGDVVFFCSPSAVRSFANNIAGRPPCVAIGETTASVCRAENFPTQVADSPNLKAMNRAASLFG
ncbi:MAG: uroporphyrinogen-III synthase [Candidatus Krumholzibacteriia bacterium]|jgi:uroporphyrinogen-III synthase